MGRIAAQAAKQNLIQHIRDAERKQIYNEFKDRKGEIVSGIVQRFERKNMIVNLGRTEAILPEKEQIPHERYRQGDRIRFTHVGTGLVAKDGPVRGFAIAGADRKFHWAAASIDGDSILVSSPEVPTPVAVRYAWGDSPECNLFNREGLPASPFRTDSWPGITGNCL